MDSIEKKVIYFFILMVFACVIFSEENENMETGLDSIFADILLRSEQFSHNSIGNILIVKVGEQKMYLIDENMKIKQIFLVSTAKNGIGNLKGSNKTPLGFHRIVKIAGRGEEKGVFFNNDFKVLGFAKIYTDTTDSPDDMLTSRVFVLEGLEDGVNKGENIDSFDRKIFVHGTNEEGLLGKPMSKGCIRMNNDDIINLAEIIAEGTLLYINE